MISPVLIFGGAGGIGSAVARRLAAQKIPVHLAGRSEGSLQALADEIGAHYTVGDVHDESFFKQASESAGSDPSGLLYAVGTINLAPVKRTTAVQIREDFEVNAVGAALAVQAALPALKAGVGGSVVLMSSVAASKGFPFHTSIGMAKAAVEGLTVSLAAELAPQIRVNALAPSLTRTPLASSMLNNPSLAETIAKQHPLKRLGEAEDVAALATLLLTQESRWITGQVMKVDGGRSTVAAG